MRTLGALEARYADDHVPLALALGALAAVTAVRRLLPDEPVGGASRLPKVSRTPTDVETQPEAFVALLLGAIVTHARLLDLLGPPPAEHEGGDARVARGGQTHRLEGLMR